MLNVGRNLIIGIPGLLHAEEKGRIDSLIEIPNAELHKLRYSGIERKGQTINVKFNLEQYVQDLKNLIDELNPKLEDNLGVIASSLGAAVFTYYLTSYQLKIDWYIANSPFCKLNPDLVPWISNHILREEDLEISSTMDNRNGIRRIIPKENISQILEIECNNKLADYKKTPPQVLTIFGNKDERADYKETRKYHQILGGKTEDLVEFDSGHDVPLNQSLEIIINFVNQQISQRNIQVA